MIDMEIIRVLVMVMNISRSEISWKYLSRSKIIHNGTVK